MPKYSSHSTRHSFAFLNGLSGLDATLTQTMGRWLSTSSFVTYFTNGNNNHKHHEEQGRKTELQSLWLFKDLKLRTLNGVGRGQLLSQGQLGRTSTLYAQHMASTSSNGRLSPFMQVSII